jgi:hypothetical protein
VPDEPEARLVVLGPEYPHSGKSIDSPARGAAQQILEKRASGERLHRNMLVFLAPDRARLAELHQAVRDFLAWKSIESEKETLNLDNFQSRQAETKRIQFDEAVTQRVGETFTWVLVPSQSVSDPQVAWEETRVSGPDPLAVRVAKKLRSEEALISQYSGARLRMDLDRVPLWRGNNVGVKQLWSDYSQYLYLPRLRDSEVLLDAIRHGVSLLDWDPDTFAYASAFDEATGRYKGLVAGEHAAVVLDTESVLVKPETAHEQMEEVPPRPPTPPGPAGAHGEGTHTGGGPTVSIPNRFYGRVSVDPVRMLRDLSEVADAVVAQLARADADVTLTLEIEARTEKGFAEDVRRTVSENARTLKFQTHEFEEE